MKQQKTYIQLYSTHSNMAVKKSSATLEETTTVKSELVTARIGASTGKANLKITATTIEEGTTTQLVPTDEDQTDCWGSCSVSCGIGVRHNVRKLCKPL